MKAITLWQPWATLCFVKDPRTGLYLKTIETRTHDRFKGLVGQRFAIHAGKRWHKEGAEEAIRWIMKTHDWSRLRAEMLVISCRTPVGAIVGTVKGKAGHWLSPADSGRALCDCTTNRHLFGLTMTAQEKFDTPRLVPGKQGLWAWDETDNERGS